MRRCTLFFKPLVAVVFGSLLVGDARFARSDDDRTLTVAIAVPTTGQDEQGKPLRVIALQNDQCHFHVVVINTSDKPLRLWETWNSWGYYNLRFEVADSEGKILYTIKKKSRFWTRNFASWFELAVGEPFVARSVPGTRGLRH